MIFGPARVPLHHQRDPEDLPALGGRGAVELTGGNLGVGPAGRSASGAPALRGRRALRLASLALLLGLVPVAGVTAGLQLDRRPSGQPAGDRPPSPPAAADPSWEIQFAGHGGVAGLVSRGEVRLAIASSVSPVDETVGYSRERSWGAGLRVIRGRWGVEVRHHRVASRGFMPAAMMRETRWFGADELPLAESADDLLSVFAVREFPLPRRRARFHLAAGGGYLLMGGAAGRLVLEDLPPGISRLATFGGASRQAAIEMTEGDFRADRGVAVLGGSLGLTLRMGRMFLRPRFDVFSDAPGRPRKAGGCTWTSPRFRTRSRRR